MAAETVEQLCERLNRDHPDVAGLFGFELITEDFFSLLRQFDVVVDDETIDGWPAELERHQRERERQFLAALAKMHKR